MHQNMGSVVTIFDGKQRGGATESKKVTNGMTIRDVLNLTFVTEGREKNTFFYSAKIFI